LIGEPYEERIPDWAYKKGRATLGQQKVGGVPKRRKNHLRRRMRTVAN